MATQGLGNSAAFRIRNGTHAHAAESQQQKCSSEMDNVDTALTNPSDKTRTELISLVRQKIKMGFYNSEAVLDDLSYGFAEALDHSV